MLTIVNYAKKLPLLPEKKSFQDNEFDNKENVNELLNCVINVLIYCYKSHSDFVLKNEWLKILKSTVLNDLLEKAKPAAQKNLFN
jgi:peptidyl-dipeptidase Dcp